MVVYDSKRRPIRLGREIGRGGESAVYQVERQPDYLVKIYTTPHVSVYEHKLAWMLAYPPDDPTARMGHASIAWPLEMLYDGRGAFVGYLMPYIQNAATLLKVFNPRLRTQTLPGFDWRYLHRTARNLAVALGALHARNYVIGDLHESNVMVTPSALVTLIDTDSFQVEVQRPDNRATEACPEHSRKVATTGQLYPCIVGKPEYTPPELQGKNFRQVRRAPEHDCFGLGVLVFQLLMGGNHPFRGRWLGQGDPPPLEEKIRQGLFPYVKHPSGLVAPPPTGLALETLHPGLARLLQRCFVDGHSRPTQRPTPDEWERALSAAEEGLVQCRNGHYYSNHLAACPSCRAQLAPRRRPRRPVAPRPVLSPVPQMPSIPGVTPILDLLRAWVTFFLAILRQAISPQLARMNPRLSRLLLLAIMWWCVLNLGGYILKKGMEGGGQLIQLILPATTVAPRPTNTPRPPRVTNTPWPTLTPLPPGASSTPWPTNTPVPTFTPRPPTVTSVPLPTNTAVLVHPPAYRFTPGPGPLRPIVATRY